MSALTGILAFTLTNDIEIMVEKYVEKANKSVIKKRNQGKELVGTALENEFKRAVKQQTSVYFLCAAVLSRPYDTPKFVPRALAALSKHSYERTAPFTVREAVKLCCREYKRTHMTDNWEVHKQQFSQEQLEALDDVVSTPHYYA
jgi:proteasome activator subunit 4